MSGAQGDVLGPRWLRAEEPLAPRLAPIVTAPNITAPNITAPNITAPNVAPIVEGLAPVVENIAPIVTTPARLVNRLAPIEDAPVQPPGPPVLSSPLEEHFVPWTGYVEEDDPWIQWPVDPPLGFTGPSGILPRERATSSHFLPIEDRWRIGFADYDRYGKGFPWVFEYPNRPGAWWDPYHQNVLKGDYPILGQHTFLSINVVENLLLEYRQIPTPTTPFESTGGQGQSENFGDPNQFFLNQNLSVGFDLTHGNGAFKPPDWRLKATSFFNSNYLSVGELAVVNPDVRKGKTRLQGDYALEEWFFEYKLADLSPDYDFASVRAGSQPFVSDFRGFLFADTNRAVRLFGTRNANRDQFNVIWFDQQEKDTNSSLNTFDDRHQNTVIMNYYRQDFVFPGYTVEASYHYNVDHPSFKFNDNNFLVRPDPAGVFAPHEVQAHYLGFAGDGHINRFNISHAAYYVLGSDTLNPIAGRDLTIDAFMGACELSYDRDWMRFRTSYFFASGDGNPTDGRGRGFESILDSPAFAGGPFSYWQRQQIGLQGVNLTQRNSLLVDLRSSKTQGQSNFVNPGLQLVNFGIDADITPKARLIHNINFLWFNQTETLETFLFQSSINPFIGVDVSLGTEYRPLLNNNVIFLGGIAALIPGQGFDNIYRQMDGNANTLVQLFVDATFQY
ncbi:MAG: hypothetical protein ACKPEY_00255 [Planctomycetota bacterium]